MIFPFRGQITQTVDLQNAEGGKITVKSTLDPAYFSTLCQYPALLPSTHLQSPIQQIKTEPAELTMPFSTKSSCFSQGSPFSSCRTKTYPPARHKFNGSVLLHGNGDTRINSYEFALQLVSCGLKWQTMHSLCWGILQLIPPPPFPKLELWIWTS